MEVNGHLGGGTLLFLFENYLDRVHGPPTIVDVLDALQHVKCK